MGGKSAMIVNQLRDISVTASQIQGSNACLL